MRAADLRPSLATASPSCCLLWPLRGGAASAVPSHILSIITYAATQRNRSVTALLASTPSLSSLLPFAAASAARSRPSDAASARGKSQSVSTGIGLFASPAPFAALLDEAALGEAAATGGRPAGPNAVGIQRVAAASAGTRLAALRVCCSTRRNKTPTHSSNNCRLWWLASNNRSRQGCRWRRTKEFLLHKREPCCCCCSTLCAPGNSRCCLPESDRCGLPESDRCMRNVWPHPSSSQSTSSCCCGESSHRPRRNKESACRRRRRKSKYESFSCCTHVFWCCCKGTTSRRSRGFFSFDPTPEDTACSSWHERSDCIDKEGNSNSTLKESGDDSRTVRDDRWWWRRRGSPVFLTLDSNSAVSINTWSALTSSSSSKDTVVSSAEHTRSNKRSFSSSRSDFSSKVLDDIEQQQQHQRSRMRLPAAGLLRAPDMQIHPLQVVLVGRPNVGKSMLFNRLLSGTRPCGSSRRRSRSGSAAAAVLQTDCHMRRDQLLQQAIVSPQAGTTRDRRIARAVFGRLQLLLVDTGGLEDRDITQASQLLTNMRKQVRVALRDADCVLFVVDATEGITPVDVLLARLVREWLEEDEQQKQPPQHPQGSTGSSESTAATAFLTVRAAEKSVGGRPAMQQHHTGGRRLLVLPSPSNAAAAARRPAASTEALSGGEARQLITADEAARETTAAMVCSVAGVSRQAIADAPAAAACSEATPGSGALAGAAVTALPEGLLQDSSVPVILVANKADGCFLGSYLSDCYDLDLGSPVIVSAKKNEGFDDLYDRLVLEIGHRQQMLDAVWQPAADADAGFLEERHVTGAERTLNGKVGRSTAELVDDSNMSPVNGVEQETAPATAVGSDLLTPDAEKKYIYERVLRPPQPSGEAGTWIEGLMRRYGRCGLSESYKQLCDPTSSMHLPWDLSRTSLAAAVGSEASAASSDAAEAASNGFRPPRPTNTAASDSQQKEKVAAARAEWQQASAGVIIPMEEASVSLRSRRKKLKTKEGRDRFLSLKRQLLFDETIHLAVIGRPNVGKSTLVNALLGQERMIVSDEPGTTTDSVASDWEYKRHPFCLIDTSGVTRGWKVKHTDLLLEAGMQTLRNIRRSQVCILCVDGSAAESSGVSVSAHELALAHLATSKEGRCLVVCVTKWDLVSEQQRERIRTEILERLQTGLGHLKGCPIVFTAAKHGHNLDTLMNRVLLLYRRWNARVPTSKLNAWLQQFLLHFPPPWRLGSRCQIKYLTQVKARPPTFVAWSNVYSAFPVNYQRQLQNAMREEFSLGGTPIRFILRTTANLPTGKRLSKKELLKWRRKTHRTCATSNKASRKVGHEDERNDSAEAAASS